MYQISCDGLILHDVRLPKEYRVLNPVCKLEVNTAGTLSFKIAPSHPYYDRIQKLTSVITLTQDGEWIFSGRVLNDETDFRKLKTIKCEGELSYLVDSNQRSAEYHDISVADYFSTLISKHNQMVGSDKQFTVGSVTVTDGNDSLYRYSSYETTMDTIKEKLINRLGGYVRIRHSGSVRYIDYVSTYENINSQTINFGKNLLNLTKYVNGEDIATAVIPLGARSFSEDGTQSRLTIESVNGGLDYVYDQDSVNQFGWIFETVIFDDVTLPANLKTKGQQELTKRKLLSIRLDLNAVDLHLLDVDIERFKLGDKIKVISDPHGINEYMMVSSMTINIEDPAQNTICLGSTSSSLTDMTNSDGIKNTVEQAFTDYGITSEIQAVKQEIQTAESEIARTSEQILLAVSESYASKTDLNAVNQELSTRMTINSNSVDLRFNTVQNETQIINDTITANQQLLEEYIRFQGALIELGKIGNSFVAKLSNEKLAFLQDNVEIAYISNNRLYITDAEVRNKLILGSYQFVPRSNGNLSLKWGG